MFCELAFARAEQVFLGNRSLFFGVFCREMDIKSHKAIIHILLLLQIIEKEGHIIHCFLAKKIQKIENIYKKIFYNSKIIIYLCTS